MQQKNRKCCGACGLVLALFEGDTTAGMPVGRFK
jgi:hypothetical protein